MIRPLQRIGWTGNDLLLGLSLQGPADIHLLLVSKVKDELQAIQSWQFNELETLKKELNRWPGVPIVLYAPTEAAVENEIQSGSQDVISATLGFGVEDRKAFCYQQIPLKNGNRLVHLRRREDVDEILKSLGKLAKRVIVVNFSEAVLAFCVPALFGYEEREKYTIQGYVWESALVGKTKEAGKKIETADLAHALSLDEKEVPIYASVLQYHIFSVGTGHAPSLPGIQKNRQTWQQNHQWLRRIGYGLTAMLALFILMSLGNQFLNWKSQAEQERLISHRSILQSLSRNDSLIQQQQDFIHQAATGMIQQSKVSFYLDRILAQSSKSLGLSRWAFAPTENVLKKLDDRLPDLQPDILIEGSANESVEIAAFTAKVGQLDFTKRAELFDNTYDFQQQQHQFILLIWLNP
ncbi:MAG: hypothetical protein AAF206_01210 [Bacteroidota bacterium]